MKRARRKPKMSRLERAHLTAYLHLLADGDRREVDNQFLPIRFAHDHERFRALWAEHGAAIVERWREVGHQPSGWWQWVARGAGIEVPRIPKVAA